jgi:hypothetical protein
MAKTPASRDPARDPFKTVADALDAAIKTAKDTTTGATAAAGKSLPAAGRFLTRLVYTTSYVVSYGVVFPTVMVARSIPGNNPVVHGFVDGARAAKDSVSDWKERKLKSSAKPRALSPSKRSPSATGTRRGRKRKTAD